MHVCSKKHLLPDDRSGHRGQWAVTGLTLIEIVVAVSIMVLIFATGLIATITYYNKYTANSERDNVVGILKRARGKAQNNINQSNQGVYFATSSYTIFQGASYASRVKDYDENFPRASGLNVTGTSQVVFAALTGESDTSGTITLTYGGVTTTIRLNGEGMVDW